jgi:hypothetical protein
MRGDRFDRGDGFYQTGGSSQWPSDDPEDSPDDTFECKLCEYTFQAQMYGGSWVGVESFDLQIYRKIQAHMLAHVAEKAVGR